MARSYTLSEDARAGREARKTATKEALLEAARLLAGRRGIGGLSVTEVARLAGVSHSLINTYFHGKAGLIAELVKERNLRRMAESSAIAAGEGKAADRLRGILESWARFDLADPALLRVLRAYSWEWSDLAEAGHLRDRAELMVPVARVLADGRGEGAFRSDVADPDALAAIWAIYTIGMRSAVFSAPIPTPEKAIAAIWGQIAAIVIAVTPQAPSGPDR